MARGFQSIQMASSWENTKRLLIARFKPKSIEIQTNPKTVWSEDRVRQTRSGSSNSKVNDVTSLFRLKESHLKCIPFKLIKFSWYNFLSWLLVRSEKYSRRLMHQFANYFRSKLLSPLTLTNNKQMEDIRFDEIKYSHPLWDELSETIFFKNIQ